MDVETKRKNDRFIDAILRAWHPLHSTRALVAELDACDNRELDRMAGDLALSARDLREVTAPGADAAGLLPRRMGSLHLDIEQIGRAQPRVLWDLQKLCTLCGSKRRCARDLAADADSAAWQAYCPNYDTLSALEVQVLHLSDTLSPPLVPAARSHLDGAALRPEQRRIWGWLWALLFLACAWIAVESIAPRLDLFQRGNGPAPSALDDTAADAGRAVVCLDTSCLDEQQQAALQTVADFQEQGAVYSTAEQMAAAQRAAPMLRKIRIGEAAACREAGGITSYGPMFQVGCTSGVVQAGRQIGYGTCRPMAAGGVCLLK